MSTFRGLHWTVKRAFLRYIASMPDGRCSVTDGAGTVKTAGDVYEPFSFELERLEVGDPVSYIAAFRGDLRFTGHHGFLFVRIANPIVRISGNRGILSVENIEPGGPETRLVRFTIRSKLENGVSICDASNVRLTEEGTALFGGVYPTDEAFDDLKIFIPAEHARGSAVGHGTDTKYQRSTS